MCTCISISTWEYGQSAQARLIEVEAITYGSHAIIFFIYIICVIKYGWRMKCKVMFDTLIFLHHNSVQYIYSKAGEIFFLRCAINFYFRSKILIKFSVTNKYIFRVFGCINGIISLSFVCITLLQIECYLYLWKGVDSKYKVVLI